MTIPTITGTDGNDTLFSTAADEIIDGGKGFDFVSYANILSGVTVSLALSTSQNTGGGGHDTLLHLEGIIGSGFADSLTGSAAADTLLGGQGDDLIYGGTGNDSLDGGNGNDTLDGGSGADTLNGGAGIDTAAYVDAGSAVTVDLNLQGAPQNTIGASNDTLLSIENLTGSNFADHLTGDGGVNVLIGGAGNDTLTGGAGGDVLTGGTGADTFVYTSLADSTFSPKTQDVITDFSHADGDQIDLSQIDPSFSLVASFTHMADQLIVTAAPAKGADAYLVQGDVNGDGKADFAILVHSATALVAGDFIL